VKITGFSGAAEMHLIDETRFASLTKDPAYMMKPGTRLKSVKSVSLLPYAVTRIRSL
jgi:hypothetical protein